MMRHRSSSGKGGFTLVELMVVISIIAILASMLAPVIRAVKSSVMQSVASRAGGQLFMATTLYLTDYDDTYPLAMYTVENGAWQTWFGRQTGPSEFDSETGILGPYLGKTRVKDPTLTAEPFIGDDSGFGYNYGFIGSDFHVTEDYRNFPNCKNPAVGSQLENVSSTVVFATSSFYNAIWYPNGDGATYQFNFIDPPDFWYGNPNVDFRHHGRRKPSETEDVVVSEGRAVIVFADGNVKGLTQSQLKQEMFTRTGH